MKKKIVIISVVILVSLFIGYSSVVFAKYGVRVKTSHCVANQVLPDSSCTPGAIMATSTKIICKAGYTKTVRDVPLSVRKAVFKEYGIDYAKRGNYEVDHLISLELGGSNDISNLWPESYKLSEGAIKKDSFENYLHSQICSGKMAVKDAQFQISSNWLKYDQQRRVKVGATTTTIIATSTPKAVNNDIVVPIIVNPIIIATTSNTESIIQPQVQNNNDPQVKKSSTGICHEKGTTYYARTLNFTPYNSITDCLNSGGRLPLR